MEVHMNYQKQGSFNLMRTAILVLVITLPGFLTAQESPNTKSLSDHSSAAEMVAQDKTPKEEITIPKQNISVQIKPGIELKQRIDFHVLEGNIQKTQIGRYQDAIYERTEFKAKFDIIIDDLTITPWVKERLGGRFNFRDDDPVGDTEDTVNIRFRNRFYTGLSIGYDFDDIAICLNNEFRFESDLKAGKSRQNLDFRYAPVLSIQGDHELGLWWKITQYFAFHFDPKLFTMYDLDGAYELGYTFWNKKGAKGTILSAAIFSQYEMRWRSDAEGEKTRLENEFFGGFELEIGSVKPFVGYWMWSYDEMEGVERKSDKLHGLKAGLAVQKDKISFGLNYKGGVNLNEVDESKGWQSAVSTSIKIKF